MNPMHAIAATPICPLYTKPDHHSALADEALYGMILTLLEESEDGWYRVRTPYRYEGYVHRSNLLIGEKAAQTWCELPKKVILEKNICDILSEPKFQSYSLITLPRGAVVSPVGAEESGWQKVMLCDGSQGYTRSSFLGEYYDSPPFTDENALRQLIIDNALRYKGTQYRWGGKSPMGIDCSGLVSMAYLLSGIIIYRDARMADGFPIHPIALEDAKPGDLLYFPGHIALYLGEGHYLHSTGKAGSDGFAFNSLNSDDPDFRSDLKENLTAVGSYF